MDLSAMLQEMLEAGLTQSDIEKLTSKKVNQGTISKILNKKIKNVWHEKADAIKRAYFDFKQQKAPSGN